MVVQMACDPLSYAGVDASKWETLRGTIEDKYGIRIDSEEGDAKERGFSLRWAYDSSAETLEIQCLEKPFDPRAVLALVRRFTVEGQPRSSL